MKLPIKDRHFRDFVGAASVAAPDMIAPEKSIREQRRALKRQHKPEF